ncbi:MAG: amino acid ABC transporter permease [Streptococcaceae bacterium]|jgi:polar amino acid transport system permease protein|nr:amino acid ABC transporter permease [Streptococcaceae bacterium]
MNYIESILPQLLSGFWTTLLIFSFTIIVSIPLGILVAFLLRLPVVKWVLHLYIWVMRGTPLLLQIIIFYYGPALLGMPALSRLASCLLAFILNYCAYFAEIFRGGIEAVPTGQIEAAKVLHLSGWQTARFVTLPQVVRIVIPSVMNEVINLVKDSSLVYIVGLFDIMQAANVAMQRDTTIVPFLMAGVFYLAFIAILTLLSRGLEMKLKIEK